MRDDGVVKILDFGLARLGEESLSTRASRTITVSKTNRLRGKPGYMSPEQAAGGRATRKSDVFALGVMLYELVTGEGAFLGETIPHILSQIQTVDPDKLAAAVPKPLAAVVSRALVCDAHDRDITMLDHAPNCDCDTEDTTCPIEVQCHVQCSLCGGPNG